MDELTYRTIRDATQVRPLTGDVLAAIRSWLAMPDGDLADLLDVPAQQIRDLEAGGAGAIVPDELADLCEAYVVQFLLLPPPAELRRMRESLGLDHEEVGACAGIDADSLQRAEQGRQAVDPEMLRALRYVLKRSEEDTFEVLSYLLCLGEAVGQDALQTYTDREGLQRAQAELPAATGGEDPLTRLLRTSSPGYHRRVLTQAAAVSGHRVRSSQGDGRAGER